MNNPEQYCGSREEQTAACDISRIRPGRTRHSRLCTGSMGVNEGIDTGHISTAFGEMLNRAT